MQNPLTGIQTDYKINRPTRLQVIAAKRNYFYKRQTDRQLNRCFFFEKEKNTNNFSSLFVLTETNTFLVVYYD